MLSAPDLVKQRGKTEKIVNTQTHEEKIKREMQIEGHTDFGQTKNDEIEQMRQLMIDQGMSEQEVEQMVEKMLKDGASKTETESGKELRNRILSKE